MSSSHNSAVRTLTDLASSSASRRASTSSDLTRREIQSLATPSSTLRASEDLSPGGLEDLEKGGESSSTPAEKEGKSTGEEWDEDGVVIVDGIETAGLKGVDDPLS